MIQKSPHPPMTLDQLKPHVPAQVIELQISSEPGADAVARRLLELGFVAGAAVQIMHEAPFSRDPVAVSVRGSLIALRRAEARLVVVESQPSKGNL